MPLKSRILQVEGGSRQSQMPKHRWALGPWTYPQERGQSRTLLAHTFLPLLKPPNRSIIHSINSEPNVDNDAPAAASQDQPAPQFSINNISRFSFASIIQQDSTTDEEVQKDSLDFEDFLAPINFDEFHNSITTDEPSLSHFPLPGRGPSNAFRPVEENKTLLPQPINPPASTRKVSGTTSISRKNSLARQQNNPSTSLSRTSSKSESLTTGPATSVLRSRRQSHFPPNSYSNANTSTKAPRKSIGPGTFIEPDPSENKSPGRRPSVGVRKRAMSKSSWPA